MFGGELKFDGGSIYSYKERPGRVGLTAEQKERKQEFLWQINKGVRALRQIRGSILAAGDHEEQQGHFSDAYALADAMAETVVSYATNPDGHSIERYQSELLQVSSQYGQQDDSAMYGLPTSASANTILRCVTDMIVRIEELTGSLDVGDRRLSEQEMLSFLREFLVMTNNLSSNACEVLLRPETKVVGILSGGLVDLLAAKRLVNKYGFEEADIVACGVAISDEGVAFQLDGTEGGVKSVVIVDDLINTGNTSIKAYWAAQKVYGNADIYSGTNPVSRASSRRMGWR